MRTRLLGAVLLAALASAMALPAHAVTPTLRTENDYFHCPANQTTPVGNLTIITDGTLASWDATAPAASVADGAGCAYANTTAASGAGYQTVYDALFEGTFNGNLDSITVRAYSTSGVVTAPVSVSVHLGIDGASMFGESKSATGDPSPGDATVDVTPQTTDSGLTLLEFTITGIGFASEDGDGTAEHTVQMTLNAWSDPVNLFPLDTVEAPAGLTFNPATPAPATLAAKTPGPAA